MLPINLLNIRMFYVEFLSGKNTKKYQKFTQCHTFAVLVQQLTLMYFLELSIYRYLFIYLFQHPKYRFPVTWIKKQYTLADTVRA